MHTATTHNIHAVITKELRKIAYIFAKDLLDTLHVIDQHVIVIDHSVILCTLPF